jgi:hypothetical protein
MKTILNTALTVAVIVACLGSFALVMHVEQATAQNIQTIILDINK